jgi:subtilisin family serine protease
VKVAVVDSGFDPILRSEAQFHGLFVVQELAVDPTCTPAGFTFCGWNPTPYKDFDTTPPIGHGTQVTSIIGAVNDGSGMSGGLNGVVPKGQQPFDIYSYARYRSNPPGINGGTVSLDESALIDIAMQDFDVVNMSFAGYYSGSAYTTQLQLYKDIFSLAVGRTLFVAAASNEGVDGHLALPSAVAEELHNVISVGATATPADLDDDGDRIDARAVWNDTGRHDFKGAPCRDGIKTSESDCGSTITLAAPGEDVLALAARSCTTTIAPCAEAGSGYQAFTGTSAAAPIVTAAAAR